MKCQSETRHDVTKTEPDSPSSRCRGRMDKMLFLGLHPDMVSRLVGLTASPRSRLFCIHPADLISFSVQTAFALFAIPMRTEKTYDFSNNMGNVCRGSPLYCVSASPDAAGLLSQADRESGRYTRISMLGTGKDYTRDRCW